MITALYGVVNTLNDTASTIMTPGGVEYAVVGHFPELEDGGQHRLPVMEAVSSRDGSISFYGLAQDSDVVLAEAICRTPGVGPALAARLVQKAGAAKVVECAKSGDGLSLTKAASGTRIGRATINKILATLADAIPELETVADSDPLCVKAQAILAGLGHDVALDELHEFSEQVASAPEVAGLWITKHKGRE